MGGFSYTKVEDAENSRYWQAPERADLLHRRRNARVVDYTPADPNDTDTEMEEGTPSELNLDSDSEVEWTEERTVFHDGRLHLVHPYILTRDLTFRAPGVIYHGQKVRMNCVQCPNPPG